MCRIDPSGIHNVKRSTIPFGFPEKTVTRSAGRLINNSETLTDKAVE